MRKISIIILFLIVSANCACYYHFPSGDKIIKHLEENDFDIQSINNNILKYFANQRKVEMGIYNGVLFSLIDSGLPETVLFMSIVDYVNILTEISVKICEEN